MRIKIIDFGKKQQGGAGLDFGALLSLLKLNAIIIETERQFYFSVGNFTFNYELPNTIDVGKFRLENEGNSNFYKITFHKDKKLSLNTEAVLLGLAILKTKSISLDIADSALVYPSSLFLLGFIVGYMLRK